MLQEPKNERKQQQSLRYRKGGRTRQGMVKVRKVGGEKGITVLVSESWEMLPWVSKKKNKQTKKPQLSSALHSSEKVLHFLPKHTNKFLHSGWTLMMKKLHLPELIATIHHQAVALYPMCTQRENPQHHLSRQKKDLAVIYCSVWLMPVGRGATVQMGVKIRLPSGEFMPGELNSGNFCLCFTWNFSINLNRVKKHFEKYVPVQTFVRTQAGLIREQWLGLKNSVHFL